MESSSARPVISTYRVQVRPDFDLDATAVLAPYLASLGVTHLYSAPLLAATPDSEHGYDVVDPTHTNPELGGPGALDRLVGALHENRLGLVVDIVPNHLGVARPEANPAWWSVLRDGRDSPYALWFDIDWDRGPLLIPVLSDDRGAEDLVTDGDELRYYDHRYPIAPETGFGTPREIHERQHYRLVSWRKGDTDLTYRRFFAVSDLAAVRVEDPQVFQETHVELKRWAQAGLIDGIRVDHPDGLRDPGEYLRRLRDLVGPLWMVAEKILGYGESLPWDWGVDGTTGYDALREIGAVFIDPAAAIGFPARIPLREIALSCKREVGTGLLATELTRLLRQEPALSAVPDVREALVEVAAQLPVYRTYLPGGLDALRGALSGAAERYPEAVAALEPVLTDPWRELAIRFQQYSGAMMAKGVEDTAYYRWNRFVALNEVGGAPDKFGMTVEEFHKASERRSAGLSRSMTTLSTHDTKRGEDVRARLAVLAELAPQWREAYTEWSGRYPLDDPDLASLLWQTLVGAWPIERGRMQEYALKAAREAATCTSWAEPDDEFERTVADLVDAAYDDDKLREGIEELVGAITPAGWSNALGQKLVQLTMPGVPDTYQGTELWDNSLVDPDNRRPVNFTERAELLGELDGGILPRIDDSGAVKLLVTSRALRLRRDRPELFSVYKPVPVKGPHARHALAFDRGGAVTVVTRLPIGLAAAGGWATGDFLTVRSGRWHDVLTGTTVDGPTVPVGAVLDRYPVALLVRDQP